MSGKARVVIIDDSALVRTVLQKILATDPDIEVVGVAKDPIQAIKVIKETKPNVLTLDLEMPKMDGLTFLSKLMKIVPLPVIIISSRAERGNEATFRALELGAIDFVTKPSLAVGSGLEDLSQEIIDKVKHASSVNRQKLSKMYKATVKPSTGSSQESHMPKNIAGVKSIKSTDKIIAIGGSTGGTVAVRTILQALPANLPPILIVLHMPAGFTKSYADGLNRLCKMNVIEAIDGEILKFGYAYVAAGGKHMLLDKNGYEFKLKLTDDPPCNLHRPSVDVTFQSVADKAGANAIGIILTGMGADGANGLKEIYDEGGYTIAQDEKSSIVFGMPKQAIQVGAVKKIVTLTDISKEIIEFIE
jgi:two-component system chemotaxis response regulator CheB